MKVNLLRIAEVTVGCCLAIVLASALGLANSISAGVITILSILDTKRETLRSAAQRLGAFVIAVVIAYAAFGILGFTVWAFGVYLFCFALASYALNLQASLPICTVLVSHFWLAGHTQPWLIGNEALLMLIGTGIGVGLNLLMPRDVKTIRTAQRRIEDILRAYFLHMSNALANDGRAQDDDMQVLETDMRTLWSAVRDARKQTRTLAGNTFGDDALYYTQYMDMRRNQMAVLQRMTATIKDLAYLPPQAGGLARLMWHIAQALHEGNDAGLLLEELDGIRERVRLSPLPENRDEFEARATLYRLLMDTGHFLLLKQSFVQSLDKEDRALYQPGAAADQGEASAG